MVSKVYQQASRNHHWVNFDYFFPFFLILKFNFVSIDHADDGLVCWNNQAPLALIGVLSDEDDEFGIRGYTNICGFLPWIMSIVSQN